MAEEEEDPEDHEDVPFQGNAKREGREDVEVEKNHPDHGNLADGPAARSDEDEGQGVLDDGAGVGRELTDL